MGIAEVIPGVSGGTIAFITGIYEKLINTIKAFGPQLFKAFRQGGLAAAWEQINGTWLVVLLGGMAVGVIAGVFGVSHLLENYPEMLWAFFFGLIIASAIYIARQVKRWDVAEYLALIFGTAIAYGITVISPAEGNDALWFVFICGAIAISALILPGISGSFILLLMGMYGYVIPTVKEALSTFALDKLMVVAVFGLGCLTGLVTFSRVLSWTFKHYRTVTLALLTGFMIGSLNKIWPWRIATDWLYDADGNKEKVIVEQNVLPGAYDGEPYVVGVIVLMILGFLSVFLIERLSAEKE